jgi:hypothetical protein
LGISGLQTTVRGRRLRAQDRGVVNILQGSRAVALASGFERESSLLHGVYLSIIIALIIIIAIAR